MNLSIYDAHLHWCKNSEEMSALRQEPMIDSSLRDILDYFDRFDIRRGVVFCSPEPEEVFDKYSDERIEMFKRAWGSSEYSVKEYPINYYNENDYLSNVWDERVVFIPFISSKDDISQIERYCDSSGNPPSGIKYYGLYGGVLNDDIFEYLNEHKMCLVLHLPNSCAKKPELLLDKVGRYDNAKVQVAHLANANKEILDALGEYDNLYIDTSASTHRLFKLLYKRKGTSVEEILMSHPKKILYGSDMPWANPEEQIKSVENAKGLSKRDKHNILRGNFKVVWGSVC